jgi:hypothetical protein
MERTRHTLFRSVHTRTKYATLQFAWIYAKKQFTSSAATHTVGCLAPYIYHQNAIKPLQSFQIKENTQLFTTTSFPSHQVSIFTHMHSVHFARIFYALRTVHITPVTSHQHALQHGYNAVAKQCGAGSHLPRRNRHPLPTKSVKMWEIAKADI